MLRILRWMKMLSSWILETLSERKYRLSRMAVRSPTPVTRHAIRDAETAHRDGSFSEPEGDRIVTSAPERREASNRTVRNLAHPGGREFGKLIHIGFFTHDSQRKVCCWSRLLRWRGRAVGKGRKASMGRKTTRQTEPLLIWRNNAGTHSHSFRSETSRNMGDDEAGSRNRTSKISARIRKISANQARANTNGAKPDRDPMRTAARSRCSASLERNTSSPTQPHLPPSIPVLQRRSEQRARGENRNARAGSLSLSRRPRPHIVASKGPRWWEFGVWRGESAIHRSFPKAVGIGRIGSNTVSSAIQHYRCADAREGSVGRTGPPRAR
ncbi:hypothetical protein AXG93_2772s1090 [Marchantia polymorpha subsp. ruderalis]|uniref:Uncharacterized protein n=1 Tax=Marchantia polymorpha subsp. ruderalis TaxID=1480154 RepID=A0A176WFL5_MARPO|nr:hypothetical protein AXG93_2772s1090 [Marchantia polymorpha subsp. ruderalis]